MRRVTQGPSWARTRISKKTLLAGSAVFCAAFGIYLWILYGQLTTAFTHPDQFIPTRIYSDVTRIVPPQTRGSIEDKLKALGYSPKTNGNELQFVLHAYEYPTYLLPDQHPQIDVLPDENSRRVILTFSGKERTEVLQSIQLGGREIQDIYLEPELVTALSRGSKEKREIRSLVHFEDIPAPVWKAIIAVEDHTFLEHWGLNPRGLLRALWVNAKTLSFAQGGSTITQQLVKNLMARHTKNLVRKVNEVFLALLLEATYDKEAILERYLNEVYLGQVGSFEVHGVAEGAEHFFGKDVKDLNLAETALMAGLIRGPGYYSPYRFHERAIERQRFVLKRMVETGQIAEAEAQAALSQPIHLAPPTSIANKAPYFTDFVKAELLRQLRTRMSEEEITEAGFRVYTTLDMSVNASAQDSVAQGLTDLEKKMRIPATTHLEGALAAVDQSTGYIRALVGGRNYSHSMFNRILNMKRQVGSTFKPLVYLTAFRKGRDGRGIPYGPGYPVEDSPWTLRFDGGRQTWTPRNYDKDFLGWIPLRSALAHSINTATARLGYEVGIDEIVKTARLMGIQSDLPSVPSLSLGVAELSPIELVQVYATFANHGVQDELTVIRAITHEDGTSYARFIYHPQQVVDSGAADLLTDMLTSVFNEGTAKSAVEMGFDRPAAGKTGTTSNYRDAWFAGYTPQLTAVVWVGEDTTAAAPAAAVDEKNPKQKDKGRVILTGGTSALPIWVRFMKQALAGDPPMNFPTSSQLVNLSIDRKSGLLADFTCPPDQVVTEKYMKGKEPLSSGCSPIWPDSVRETAGK